jgi:hypothetical protein
MQEKFLWHKKLIFTRIFQLLTIQQILYLLLIIFIIILSNSISNYKEKISIDINWKVFSRKYTDIKIRVYSCVSFI